MVSFEKGIGETVGDGEKEGVGHADGEAVGVGEKVGVGASAQGAHIPLPNGGESHHPGRGHDYYWRVSN